MDEFKEIAYEILNTTGIKVGDKIVKIREIEMYLYSDNHKDEYVHCRDEQLNYKKFYFHKFKGGSFKNGTYRGMDYTFGNREENKYFGILIRSIELPDGTFVEGPCCSINALVKMFGVGNNGSSSELLDLEEVISMCNIYDYEDELIFYGPRIGLSNKYPEYRELRYRFATNIKRIKKERSKFISIDI
jgi:hypothetical protein